MGYSGKFSILGYFWLNASTQFDQIGASSRLVLPNSSLADKVFQGFSEKCRYYFEKPSFSVSRKPGCNYIITHYFDKLWTIRLSQVSSL